MRILITNDDGIYSPGLAALARVAARFGDVRIVAPDVEMSSAGHSITSARPLSYKRTPIGQFEAYRVNGTPADCVALGMHHWEALDVVLSGINLGSNLGNGMWHSGTLAAARQAVLFGLRGIALSAPASEDPDFDALDPFVERVLRRLLPARELALVNVNFPEASPQGLEWTRQSVRHYDGHVVPGTDPMGRQHFWFVVRPMEEAEQGTDRWAVEHGRISMTPLRLDLTNEEELEVARRRHSEATTATLAPGCLDFVSATQIVKDAVGHGNFDLEAPLGDLYASRDERLLFRERVFRSVLDRGCEIEREDIPADAANTQREVRDAIKWAAS